MGKKKSKKGAGAGQPEQVPQTSQVPVSTTSQAAAPQPSQAPVSITSQTPTPQTSQAPAPQASQAPAPQASQAPVPQSSQAPAPQSSQAPAPQSSQAPAPQSSETSKQKNKKKNKKREQSDDAGSLALGDLMMPLLEQQVPPPLGQTAKVPVSQQQVIAPMPHQQGPPQYIRGNAPMPNQQGPPTAMQGNAWSMPRQQGPPQYVQGNAPMPRQQGPPQYMQGNAPMPRQQGPPQYVQGNAPMPNQQGPPMVMQGNAWPMPRQQGPPQHMQGNPPMPRQQGPPQYMQGNVPMPHQQGLPQHIQGNAPMPHQQGNAPMPQKQGLPQHIQGNARMPHQQGPPTAIQGNAPVPQQVPTNVAHVPQQQPATPNVPQQQPATANVPQQQPQPMKPVAQQKTPPVVPVTQAPSQESGILIPKRKCVPDSKKLGRKIVIETNHLAMTLSPKQNIAIHYDVAIDPDKPKKLMMPIFLKYVGKYFPGKHFAFDGMKNMYSPTTLNIPNQTHSGMVEIFEDGRNKGTEYEVKIHFAAEVDLSRLFTYMASGTSKAPPQSALQCLDVVMRHSAHQKFVKVGRSFYSRPNEEVYSLGGGLDLWYGHFQSAILGWKPYLNIDVAHKGFSKEQTVLKLIDELDTNYNNRCLQSGRIDRETLMTLRRFIRNLKIIYQIPNQAASKRICNVKDIVDSPLAITFQNADGKKMTVYDYFITEKKYKIQYPNFPCVAVGKDKKVCYPVELCTVVGGQSILMKMDGNQTKNLIYKAATKPPIRKNKIYGIMHKANYNEDPVVKAFGLSVGKEFEKAPARILNAPTLAYNGQNVVPMNGVWNPSKFNTAASLNKWRIIYMDRIEMNKINGFVRELENAAKKNGMTISPPEIVFVDRRNLSTSISKAAADGLQMLLVIIFRNEDYASVKKPAELNHGLLTQCIKKNTIDRMNSSTASMLLQKVNSKLNSTNHVLAPISIPNCLKKPCMIVGADVTHPSPGQDNVPSFVAVTASHDKHAYKYNIALKIQPPAVEIIQGLEEMIKKHLLFYYKETKAQPQHIVMFRDGVSEGQFDQVLNSELMGIRAACSSLSTAYKPHISIFIVQKRHHTRFFPTNPKDADRNGNAPAGTCVDSDITHPTELDFYLLSHASIQGTSRPTRYHCIWDDADMTDDEVEHLAYYLCHLYSRCTRAVSYPTPTYYAHLAAARAKVLTEGVSIDLNNLQSAQSKLNVSEKLLNQHPMFFV
ncbi:protein argonaute-2-like isoform X2 [Arctopsyche grandis]|uniref:protein argonaute-2-like isoform X2 n=1 Tax=Arctopsyche grandis TaxID=121162 RepID=UPI00406D9BCA